MNLDTIRVIDHRLHGMLDVVVDVALTGLAIGAWFIDASLAAVALPLTIGASNLTYSALTHYALGRRHLISLSTHLMLDAGAGIALICGAALLSDAPLYRGALFAMGTSILGAVALTNPEVPEP